MRKHLYIFLTFISLLFSCKKEKISLPTLLISPSALEQTVMPNQIIAFNINLEAEGKVSKFEITESINGESNTLVFDSTFSEITNADVLFLYKMPSSRTKTTIVLSFKIYDNNNNIGTSARKLIINPSDSLLSETTDLVLFSGFSNNKNAFLIDYDSILNSDSTFFNDIDFFSSDTSNLLERKWSSPKGNKFVVFNSFNYDSASFKTITEAYQYGNEQSTVTNLSIGDIIITKINNPIKYEYALIKLTNIVDDTGSALDRYIFNIKK